MVAKCKIYRRETKFKELPRTRKDQIHVRNNPTGRSSASGSRNSANRSRSSEGGSSASEGETREVYAKKESGRPSAVVRREGQQGGGEIALLKF